MAIERKGKGKKAAGKAAPKAAAKGKRQRYTRKDVAHDYKVRKTVEKIRARIKNFKGKEKQSAKVKARIRKYHDEIKKLLKTLKTTYSWHQLKKMKVKNKKEGGKDAAPAAPAAKTEAAPKAASGKKRGRPRTRLNKEETGAIAGGRKAMGQNLKKFRELKKQMAGAKGAEKKKLQAQYDALRAEQSGHAKGIYNAAAPLRNKKKKKAA